MILGKTQLICSGLGETELSVILLGSVVPILGRLSYKSFSQEIHLQDDLIVLVARLS